MANSNNTSLSASLLPNFYQTLANKKFLQSTIDQLFQPGTLTKISGYIGRENAKASTGADVYINAADKVRQNYQLEPGITITDSIGNITFYKDYIDYVNQIGVFGGNTSNHSRLNAEEFYSWDPHIDWDKFVNFQNYYWLPYGPDAITVYGNQQLVDSVYSVKLQSDGSNNQYNITPDGFTPNPILKLYRGQTYTFNITSPGNPFSIMSNRTTGILSRYITTGIDSYGVTSGTMTFTVPLNAPSVLYYQSESDINLGGVIEIFNITNDTVINVETDILGKQSVTLPNGIKLSNGMKLQFGGTVIPTSYATGQYYVEGVGNAIKLINSKILEIISPYTTEQSVQFDELPWDSEPFDDAAGYAGSPDYITINRSSRDHNSWSRYNRWFHKDVINTSATYNNDVVSLDQTTRATRPIIEFNADLKLFNLGTTAIVDVDLIDTYTNDAFSIIEGSAGYNVDGIDLAPGMLIIFTADLDPLVQNNIYRVEYVDVKHLSSGSNQLHLVKVSTPLINQVTLVKQGVDNQSKMFWYDGTSWIEGQQKTGINQAPLFDVVDSNGISFGDKTNYTGSTFFGTKLFSYAIGSGVSDLVLGFPLTYQNVNNIGDIVFNFNLNTDTFSYKKSAIVESQTIDVGFLSSLDYAGNTVYLNGWQTSEIEKSQAAVRIYKNSGLANNFPIDIFDSISNLSDLIVKIYVNGVRLNSNLWQLITKPDYYQVKLNNDITTTDVLTIRAFSAQPINANGYYEIPLNLQNNPLNDTISNFTLGEVTDHVTSIVDNLSTFSGSFPGDGNLRDLGNIAPFGSKFVQHSGPLSLGIYHITSETNNVIKAIEQSRTDYNSFKQNFINIANSLGTDSDTVNTVNAILSKINANKPNVAPYYLSDMVPYGACTITNLAVVDYRIKNYPLTNAFTLDVLSNQAVGIYHNGIQLIYGQDYTFNSQGFVVISDSVSLTNGDTISTYEYESTDGCFVPATPSKLGMWPAFTPKIYLDTTLVNPVNVIQGHDGSIIAAYNDYRDNLILELEKRIFNNIKVKYNTDIFDIAKIIPSYNRTNNYSRDEFNQVLAPNFYSWTGLVGKDLTTPLIYDRSNSFTFNYSKSAAPDNTSLPAYWRGIYRYILDTDRPNLCPWEMLGFNQQPSWWSKVYGPAPYTSDNLIMWQDITDGMIREPGVPAVYTSEYAKPFLMHHIPVDESGNLISPLDSGLAGGTYQPNVDNNFVFGDGSPVETAWTRSSYYPFSVIATSLILAPGQTFGVLLDRSRITRNIAGQLVYSATGLRIRPKDILLPSTFSSASRVQTAGLVNYIVDLIFNYIFSNNVSGYNSYSNDLSAMNIQLAYRVGSFTNQSQFNLLLESKTPSSTGNVFVPTDNYKVFLNKSSSVQKLVYSGVIVTKLSGGTFEVKGYSRTQPYFKYYQYIGKGNSTTIGGISENYTVYTPGQTYVVGSIIQIEGQYYRAKVTTSESPFNPTLFAKLPALPILGGVSVYLRTKWDRSATLIAPYGSVFTSVQSVVDFLEGYGEYLKDQGFEFDNYNTNYAAVANWDTSVNEFLFWTTQNWSTGQDKWSDWTPTQSYNYGTIVRYNGDYYSALYNIAIADEFDSEKWKLLPGLSNIGASVISLSPSASGVNFVTNLTVVDDVSNPFNPYEIFKVDGTPFEIQNLDSYRQGNTVAYIPKISNGIYGASFYLVQNEHVIVLSNTTIFNDIIYNPTSGYRRERLKVSGYITTNWYGGLDIPGFLYDAAKVNIWQPWQDYNVGDIVKYGSSYYQADPISGNLIPGALIFDKTQWSELASKPNDQILTNWTNIATQFTDFYSTEVDNFNSSQQALAQHLIGYQKRQYLNNIIQDDVSEFKFYQGMIREKGTQNVLNKLFNVLSSDNAESLTFYEEWAVRVGQYGATTAFDNIEFILNQDLFKVNPQSTVLVNKKDSSISPFIIQQTPNDIYVAPLGYNSNPFLPVSTTNQFLRSAGYVDSNDITLSVKTLDWLSSQPATNITIGITYVILTIGSTDFTQAGAASNTQGLSFTATSIPTGTGTVAVDITKLREGSYIWSAFDNYTGWNVYRFTDIKIRFKSISISNGVLTITTQDPVTFNPGFYIGLSQFSYINGFYQVQSVNLNSFTVNTSLLSLAIQPINLIIYGLISQRINSLDSISNVLSFNLKNGDYIWTDDSGNGTPASWIYNSVYKQSVQNNPLKTDYLLYGKVIATGSKYNIAATGMSTGQIITYDKVGSSVDWIQRQLIPVPFIAKSSANAVNTISTVLAISPDGTWLAAGSPGVGYASTNYVGVYSPLTAYLINQVVYYENNFYSAILNVPTAAYPDINSAYWIQIPYLSVTQTGTNIAASGVITLYQKDANNTYNLVDTILSPSVGISAAVTELFGSSLAFDSNNNLYIGAIGYNSSQGKIYSLSYTSSTPVTTYYDSVGSSGTVLNVSSTAGIVSGMTVAGTGFTKNQPVASVLTKVTFQTATNTPNYIVNSQGLPVSLLSITPGLVVNGTNVLANTYIYSVGVNPIIINITSVVPSSPSVGYVTLNFDKIPNLPILPQDTITVTNVSEAGYNGNYTVVSVSNTHITYANTTTTSATDNTGTIQSNINYALIASAKDAVSTISTIFLNVEITGVNYASPGEGLVTLTFAELPSTPFASGSTITVSGISVSGYNGTYEVVAGTTTSVTYYNSTIIASATSGTITNPLLQFNVRSVASAGTIILSGTPDSTPNGLLMFSTTNWRYSSLITNPSLSPNSYFGKQLVVSYDGNTLLTSSNNNPTLLTNSVYVYKNEGSGLTVNSIIPVANSSFENSITVSDSGTFIAISSFSISNLGLVSQQVTNISQVVIYQYNDLNSEYTSYQTITEPIVNSNFGDKLSFMNDSNTLVIYSQTGTTSIQTTIDLDQTTFDEQSTLFTSTDINGGRIDIYDNYNTQWVFSETLNNIEQTQDGYGMGMAVGPNNIFVGSPYYSGSSSLTGQLYTYTKSPNLLSWTIYRTQVSQVDIKKLKKAFLYNKSTGELLTYLDIIDPIQGKIAGTADEEIKYKSFYDPATYSYSLINTVNTDNGTFWSTLQVGQLWWDLRTAKFYDPYFADAAYRNNMWNMLAPGASIDIYEWVASTLLPSAWDALADTIPGLAQGISGTTLYGNSAYSIRQRYDTTAKVFKNTYYYWVKNKTLTPNLEGRHIPAQTVSNLIASPRNQGYTYLVLTSTNSFSLANVATYLKSSDVVLSVEYWKIDNIEQNIHTQWKLISNDAIVDLPREIEQKWIDSLCGVDALGRSVPDTSLPPKLRYGIENRPRQGMFINRVEALKEFVEKANRDLLANQIVDNYDISSLESYDKEPTTISALYDTVLDTDTELPYANINLFQTPKVSPVITNGRLTKIKILSIGRGYLIAPYIEIIGTGKGASARAIINSSGSIIDATILTAGEGYDPNTTTCVVRSYSVLVHNDSQANGNWSIYSYDPVNVIWSRTLTQSYDVRNYWSYVDWYAPGYNQFSAADFLIQTFFNLNSLQVNIGQLVKIFKVNAGGWILIEKFADSSSSDWTQSYSVVGIQNGTIQLNRNLYQTDFTAVGYDASTFDNGAFDVKASTELRIILNALKNNIFIGVDLKQSYLDLFLSSIRYAHSEQLYLDWVFKTSFVRATHNVGSLNQPVYYPIDNLSNFQDYIAEVKPYRTKIREYISQYTSVDPTYTSVTDFDLPPIIQNNSSSIINTALVNGSITADQSEIQTYPWKFWLDNTGYKITEIVIADGGSGYINTPQVIIGSPTGPNPIQATANAFFTNGIITRIIITNFGSGYLVAPTVYLSGGLSSSGKVATLVAIIGDGVIRSNSLELKFDRISPTNYIIDTSVTETFTGSGSRLQFPLSWAPDIKVGNSTVYIDNILVLRENYTFAVAKSTTSGYTQYSGTITFTTAPVANSNIVVNYNKDISILNATDRIEFYYNPVNGMIGKQFNQLMSGVDYGGNVVGNLGFTPGGGWNVLPYMTDTWSSFDETYTDYIVQVHAGNHSFTLPYSPVPGTEINIYYVSNYNISYESDGSTLSWPASIYVNQYTVTVSTTLSSASSSTVSTTLLDYSTVVQAAITATGGVTGQSSIIFADITNVVIGQFVSGVGVPTNTTVISLLDTTVVLSNNLTANPLGTYSFYVLGTTLTVTTNVGINIGTGLVGTGFSTQSVTGVSTSTIGSTVNYLVYINKAPDSIPTINETIEFITNAAGSSNLTVSNTANLKTGDIVTCNSFSAFSYNTTVISIINSTTVSLSRILYKTIPNSTSITFTRTLSNPVEVQTFNNGIILLANPVLAGSNINISGKFDPVRIDAGDFDLITEISPTNSNAVMLTPIIGTTTSPVVTTTTAADGTTKYTINIPNSFTVNSNDEFILRQSTSDGTLTPTNYDTDIDGGNLVYTTAQGISADDIVLDGDGFVTETSSPALEEVVPGQVIDALAIKVYDKPNAGSANIRVDNYITDGVNNSFKLITTPSSSGSIIVKLGSSFKTINVDFNIDYTNNLLQLSTTPSQNQILSIFVIGFSGSNILDVDYFIGDNITNEFITKAPWLDSFTPLVYVNGIVANPVFFKTDNTYSADNVIGIRFPTPLSSGTLINYIIVSGAEQTFSITNSEIVATNGGLSYTLQNPIGVTLPNESNMIVRANQQILHAPVNIYYTIENNNLVYTIDNDRVEPYTISANDVVVIVDSNVLVEGTDYSLDFSGITITITKIAYDNYIGKLLIISIKTNAEYFYNPTTKQITFTNSYSNTDVVEVTSSYRQDTLDIQRTEITVTTSTNLVQGSVEYYYYNSIKGGRVTLDRTVINENYIWVIKNSTLLVPGVDYILLTDRMSIQLTVIPSLNDKITLITFGDNVLRSGIAYMQFKDIFNKTTYTRLSLDKQTTLAADLHWNDTTITLTNGSNFQTPGVKPGVIEIRGERIEYFVKTGNILSRLRRGTMGTGITDVNYAGTFVQDIGSSETIPYSDNIQTTTLVSNGSDIVNLNFIPVVGSIADPTGILSWFSDFGFSYKGAYEISSTYSVDDVVVYNDHYYSCQIAILSISNRSQLTDYSPNNSVYWKLYPTSIPVGYGQSDQIEVFVGGYNDVAIWQKNTSYTVGIIVNVGSYTYRCITDHTSSDTFLDDATNWSFFIGNIRLQKRPYSVFNVNKAPYSPAGDVRFDADFAVDGVGKQIRLTNLLDIGTQVTVIKRTGTAWDGKNPGGNLNILNDDSKVASFIKATTGIWYSTYKKSSGTD